MALSILFVIANIGGCARAYRDRRKQVDRGYSSTGPVSLLLGIGAWIMGRDRLGLWALLPPLLDPGTWSCLLIGPYLIWHRFKSEKQPRE